MSWHFSQAWAVDFLQADCSAGQPSAPWKSPRIAGRCCLEGRETACWICSQSGMTLEPSMVERGVEQWTSSLRASRASHTASPESARVVRMIEICGRRREILLETVNPRSAFSKTSQLCLSIHTSKRFSEIWKLWGTTSRRRKLYQLMKSERRSSENGYSLWQRPPAWHSRTVKGAIPPWGGKGSLPLSVQILNWLRPTANDAKKGDYTYDGGNKLKRRLSLLGSAKSYAAAMGRGVRLNPDFHCWLMGWPLGWNALEALETESCLSKCAKHGED